MTWPAPFVANLAGSGFSSPASEWFLVNRLDTLPGLTETKYSHQQITHFQVVTDFFCRQWQSLQILIGLFLLVFAILLKTTKGCLFGDVAGHFSSLSFLKYRHWIYIYWPMSTTAYHYTLWVNAPAMHLFFEFLSKLPEGHVLLLVGRYIYFINLASRVVNLFSTLLE